MKPRFSFVAARWIIILHLGVFGLLAIVPDLIWPELEFHHYWRDTLEGWLLSPALLVRSLYAPLFEREQHVLGSLLAFLCCWVAWGAAAGLLWPMLRPSIRRA